MRHPTNRWHTAICSHLREAGAPLAVGQIWQRMQAAGFKHSSEKPRSTLGARVAELVQMRKLESVAPKTYRILEEATS